LLSNTIEKAFLDLAREERSARGGNGHVINLRQTRYNLPVVLYCDGRHNGIHKIELVGVARMGLRRTRKIGRPNAMRLRAFILTLRYTELRIGDVTSLSVDRLVGNRIFLYTQKTGQPVNCVLPPFVAEALENAPRLCERYFFWTGNSTLHTAIGSWQRTLRKLFKLTAVRGTAHCLRDTFAVELLIAGVSTEEVAVLLGHSNIGITQKHYSPWVHSRQRQLEANLERVWKRDPIVLREAKSIPASNRPECLPN
jgi:integrase